MKIAADCISIWSFLLSGSEDFRHVRVCDDFQP